MNAFEMPLFVGVGPVLVDQFVHCHDLPTGDGLPEPGCKLQASNEDHMAQVRKQWVEGWTVQTQVGGPVYVALRQAQHLGARVDFVGAIGSDYLGDMIFQQADEHGFNPENLVRQAGKRSGSAIVWIDRMGERSILFDSGSLDPLGKSDALPLLNRSVSAVHIDSREPLAARHLAEKASERNVRVHYDIDPWNEWSEDLLKLSNVAQVSLREILENDPEETALSKARRLQNEFDLDLSIVTLGDQGICAVEKGGRVFDVGAYPSYAIDSTGAGDAFAGAFEWFQASGSDVHRSLQAGCAAGAYISSHLGNPDLAGQDEVISMLGG